MSLQWTLVAGVLYIEIAIVLLLVLPIASPRRWNTFFKSKVLKALQQQAGLYFLILLAILVLFFLDAIREMRKYSSAGEHDDHKHLNLEMQENMRLFRAQRNFYISGFALFLALVIRRLVSLISSQAGLLAQSEAAIKQAQSASKVAKDLLNNKEGNEEQDAKAIEGFKEEIKELENELELERKDKLALKSQAANLSKEYDRLLEEHSKLQKKITTEGDKKSD